MACGSLLLCKMLGRMSVRSTNGVLFMAFSFSCSARIYAQEKDAQCAFALCAAMQLSSCAVVHMLLPSCSPVGVLASFQPARHSACAFSQSASFILARRRASSVQFSSVQLSVIGYPLLVIGYLSYQSACCCPHAIRVGPRVFEHVRSPSQFDVEVQSRVWQPCSA